MVCYCFYGKEGFEGYSKNVNVFTFLETPAVKEE